MPTPVTREFLLTLKVKKDEEKRIKGVNERVNHIYHKILDAAELYSGTSYKFPLTHQERHGEFTFSDSFYKDNMREILICLQILFPDCIVTHLNKDLIFECIMVNWS